MKKAIIKGHINHEEKRLSQEQTKMYQRDQPKNWTALEKAMVFLSHMDDLAKLACENKEVKEPSC